jgi:hypothetical protein
MPVSFDPDVTALQTFKLSGGGQVAFRTASAEVYAFESAASSMFWHWDNTQIASNPLGSAAIAEVRASTSNTAGTAFVMNVISSVQ